MQQKGYQQKDMTGTLFLNGRKRMQKHPDYVGKILIKGQLYFISAWVKQSQNDGKKYLSLSATLPTTRPPKKEEIKQEPVEDNRLTFDEQEPTEFAKQVDQFGKEIREQDIDEQEIPF